MHLWVCVYVCVCVCGMFVSILYVVCTPRQHSWGFGGATNNVDCQLSCAHIHLHTHQMLVWCVCDVANGSGVAAIC